MPDEGPVESEIDEALKLIKQGKIPQAQELLNHFVLNKPNQWKPIIEGKDSIKIAFWDMQEFMAYSVYSMELSKNKIYWVGPSYSKAFYILAYLNVEKKNYNKALEEIDKCLDLEPDHPLALTEKGLILSYLGDRKQALKTYKKAVNSRDWTPSEIIAKAFRGMASVLIDENQLDEAEGILLKSLELDSKSQIAKNEIEYIKELRKGMPPVNSELHSKTPLKWYEQKEAMDLPQIESHQKQGVPVPNKDSATAVLISLLSMLFLFAPGVGYIYLGNLKKGVLYILAGWFGLVALLMIYFGGWFTIGFNFSSLCCLPVLGILFMIFLAIIYDVYLVAKNGKGKLPDI